MLIFGLCCTGFALLGCTYFLGVKHGKEQAKQARQKCIDMLYGPNS